jgi:hypothetical protein
MNVVGRVLGRVVFKIAKLIQIYSRYTLFLNKTVLVLFINNLAYSNPVKKPCVGISKLKRNVNNKPDKKERRQQQIK